MEPFAKVVGRPPNKAFVDGHEPGVVPLAEFGERFFPAFVQQVQVVIEAVALDNLAGRFAKLHRYGPVFESRIFVDRFRSQVVKGI